MSQALKRHRGALAYPPARIVGVPVPVGQRLAGGRAGDQRDLVFRVLPAAADGSRDAR